MIDKDKYFYLQMLCTLVLIYIVISLLGEILSGYKLYLTVAFISGTIFSYFIKNRHGRGIRYFTIFSLLAVIAWIFYSVLNSSFVYRDVIIICVKGLILLEIVLTFNAFTPPFLTYIQILSIPLFMTHFVFLKENYTEIYVFFALCYVISWFVIFKIRFYELFKPAKNKKEIRYHSILLASVFFIIVLILAWALSYALPLGQIKKSGLFIETGAEGEPAIEKEYYRLQDETQKQLIEFLTELDSNEDKKEVIRLLGALVKESADVLEVAKAESGLVSQIKQKGPGLEEKDREALTIRLKNYIDKKIQLNFKRTKDNIAGILKQDHFNIRNRVYIFSRINKIQNSVSRREVVKEAKELRKFINNSSLGKENKNILTEYVNNIGEWKALDIYRKTLSSLNKNQDSLEQKSQKEHSRILQEMEQAGELSDFKRIDKKLEELNELSAAELKEIIKPLNEVSDLKLDMLLSKQTSNLKEKIETFNSTKEEISKLKEEIDNIEKAEEYGGLSDNLTKFQEISEQENINVRDQAGEMLETKIYSLTKNKKERIKELLIESTLSERQKEDLLKALESLELIKDSEKLRNEGEKIKTDVEEMQAQGFIYEKVKDDLVEQIKELKDIRESQLYTKEKKFSKYADELDAQAKLEEMLEKLSLENGVKEKLEKLIKELFLADTLEEIEEIKQAMEEAIKILSKPGAIEKEIEIFSEEFKAATGMKRIYAIDKSLFNLIKNIKNMENINQGESRKLDEQLRKLRNSSTQEEFKSKLNALQEYVDSKDFNKEAAPQESRVVTPWKVCVMPSRLLIPIGSFVSLKSIAIYNGLFIKELSSEIEWFSSNPDVVWVDEKGTIRSLSKGLAKIGVIYKGKVTEGTEVVVVDKMDEGIEKEIKKSFIR